MSRPLLRVEDLRVAFRARKKPSTEVVHGVNFEVERGQTLGIVGESGSGKSVSAMSLLGLLPGTAEVSGTAVFDGVDLFVMPPKELRSYCGRRISVIFQDPMTAFHPAFSIGEQIAETIVVHGLADRKEALSRAADLLDQVGVPDPGVRVDQFPHEFSGGMRQRAMIAMAIANDPELLIADEPTTALDVIIQAQVMEILAEMREKINAAMILISHDLGLVSGSADNVLVMRAGEFVERGPVREVLTTPKHPYTRSLIAAIPRLDGTSGRLSGTQGDLSAPVADKHPESSDSASVGSSRLPILEVDRLRTYFPIRAGLFKRVVGQIKAVDDVSLVVHERETLGIVGESGSGKSTLGRTILRLVTATSGSVRYRGEDVLAAPNARLRQLRSEMQVVFQDPYASLNPRMPVHDIISEPMVIHGSPKREARERAVEFLDAVGLLPEHGNRYPHEFSGGQRQRVGIARSLALNPSLLILDEPVSALDVSVQARVLDLLQDLQERYALTYLFISHDLSVVRHMSDRVAVMRLGKVVETGDAETVYRNPEHEYTQALLDAIPLIDSGV